METHQGPCHSTDDGHVVPDQLDELQAESLVDVEGTSNGGGKRQFWKVQVRNSEGQDRECPMRVRDVNSLPTGERVLIPFDGSQPSGTDADGLLGGFLGRLVQDHNIFPISFKRWPEVPEKNYKEVAWNIIIKNKFCWEPIHEDAAKHYMMKDIGKKWKENRLRLFNTYYDETKSREENIRNPPKSILATEWASFIDYRLEGKTKQMCQKNAQNRTKLTINHTGGSKKLKRRRLEIVNKTGQAVSRGNLYIQTHKRIDGTFINDEARAICEKISEIESQENTPVEISPNDSLGQVFGKEHSGRVRGVGDGVSPSQVFGSPYQRFSTSSSSFNSVEHNRVTQLENQVQKLTKESEAKDEKMNRIEKLLAQLLVNSSVHVPSDLDISLDNIQTPGGPFSHSDINRP